MTIPETGEVSAPNEVGAGTPAPSGGSQAAGPKPPKVPGNAIVNWLLARGELAQAEADAAELTVEQRECLRRAKTALEAGELVFAPGNAVRSGSTAPLATDLFRQAIYWALLAQRVNAGPVSPEQLWAETDRATLRPVAGNESEYAYLTIAMRETFIELAAGTEEAQRNRAARLRRAANRLVRDAQRVLWRVEWAKIKRFTRLALVVLVPLLVIVWLWPEKVDLAKGAAWRVSSVAIECHPEKQDCGGARTDILFHTKPEHEPWFEYDFGKPLTFSSLTIKNRSDCCPERAVPLVAEVSNDDKVFTEVAQQTDSFRTWTPSFKPQTARYLRLRVARDSMLHLEAIKVHP